MRIALFTETYLPSINGVVTHVKTLKEGLEALGHTVLVVTADSRVNNHVIADDVMYCPAVKLKKIYNYDIAPPISKERLDKIKSFAPDIIHIHNEFGVEFPVYLSQELSKYRLYIRSIQCMTIMYIM